jgi:precorrin-6B methylase 2
MPHRIVVAVKWIRLADDHDLSRPHSSSVRSPSNSQRQYDAFMAGKIGWYLISTNWVQVPYFSTWLRSFWRLPIQLQLPWTPFALTRWLESYLTKDMHVFEYGSGGSTLFFVERVEHVVAVEDDCTWAGLVVAGLRRLGCQNCEYLIREPEAADIIADEYQDPVDIKYTGQSFEKYVRAIEAYPDKHFDLVFIDGRARKGCILAARSKIKAGGYLVMDNSNYEPYTPLLPLLREHVCKNFHSIAPNWPPARWSASAWKIRG